MLVVEWGKLRWEVNPSVGVTRGSREDSKANDPFCPKARILPLVFQTGRLIGWAA